MEGSFTDFPRAMLSVAVGMIDTVERVVAGGQPGRTARGNAWEAVLADRARADLRDSVRRHVATLAAQPVAAGPAVVARAGQPAVGSSPRSSASQVSVEPVRPRDVVRS
jgi:hypothetical protein